MRKSHLGILYAIFFLSGVAGLGYQMVWARMFAIALGHEMPSVLAVVAAFFGGLALGAWALDARVSRSLRPGAWYVGLEAVIGVWGFASLALIPLANDLAMSAMGVAPSGWRHWSVAFALPFLTLLPATTAMGATLPAMERCMAPRTGDGRCVGGLYGANTAGAMIGTLAAAFVVIPQLGYRGTLMSLAVINLFCAVATLPYARSVERRDPAGEESEKDNAFAKRLGVTVFFTGLLGIGYEVIGVRLMSQVAENSIYSFAVALIVYLAGTALGAALYQRWGKGYSFEAALTWLLCALSVSCLAGGLCFRYAVALYTFVRERLGSDLFSLVARETTLGLCLFLVPTVVMGATYAHLVQASKRRDGGVGIAAAVNTLGGALAPVLFGVVLLPWVGSTWVLALIGLGYAFLIPMSQRRALLAAGIPIVIIFLLPTRMYPILLREGSRLAGHAEGVMATVSVVVDASDSRGLAVNNQFHMGDTGASVYERRQALIPLLLHGDPERALFLGVGTGMTLGGAAVMPEVSIDAVELVPEVVDALKVFGPENGWPYDEDRVRMYVADARRFVRAIDERYDVIVADLFHPTRDGAGALYTVEHFAVIKDRLADGGVFCQWLPMHQLDLNSLKTIIKTFLQVYPDASGYLVSDSTDAPALGLMSGAPLPGDQRTNRWAKRRAFMADRRNSGDLSGVGLRNELQLFGQFVAGAEALKSFAGEAQLNTDDKPIVMFNAPHYVDEVRKSRHGRLKVFLEQCATDEWISELVERSTGNLSVDDGWFARLKEYVQARDLFLEGRIARAERLLLE